MNTRAVFGHIFLIESAIAAGVFAVVVAVVVFAVVRFRDRPGREPSRRSRADVVEGCFAAVLLGFVIWLTVTTASANSDETNAPSAPAVHVDVLAYQWNWQFQYPGEGITVRGAAVGSRPTLVVPVGESVEFTLRSKDVLHEFWVPDLKFKKEAFPDHTNTFSLKVTRAGTWVGRCATFCGPLHYQMQFLIKAVSPAEFAAWFHAHHGSVITAGAGT